MNDLEKVATEASEFLLAKHVLGSNDCAVAFLTEAWSLVNKATLETMVALMLVSVVLPALFDWWDSVLISRTAAKADELRQLSAPKPLSEETGQKSKPPRHERPPTTRAQESPSSPRAEKARLSGFTSVEAFYSVAVVAVVVLLARHLLSCRPDFESFVTSRI